MSESSAQTIIFDNVSKFYGEILGVNRVNLTIPLGITSLVGPNGAGKSTLMNLMTGLLRPSRERCACSECPRTSPKNYFAKSAIVRNSTPFRRDDRP